MGNEWTIEVTEVTCDLRGICPSEAASPRTQPEKRAPNPSAERFPSTDPVKVESERSERTLTGDGAGNNRPTPGWGQDLQVRRLSILAQLLAKKILDDSCGSR